MIELKCEPCNGLGYYPAESSRGTDFPCSVCTGMGIQFVQENKIIPAGIATENTFECPHCTDEDYPPHIEDLEDFNSCGTCAGYRKVIILK